MAPATHRPLTPSSSLQSPDETENDGAWAHTGLRVRFRNSQRVAWWPLITVVAVGAEAVGGVDVVERRRPRVPELDVVGPGAEAAQVVAGVGRQQVLHRRRRSATQTALDSIRTPWCVSIWMDKFADYNNSSEKEAGLPVRSGRPWDGRRLPRRATEPGAPPGGAAAAEALRRPPSRFLSPWGQQVRAAKLWFKTGMPWQGQGGISGRIVGTGRIRHKCRIFCRITGHERSSASRSHLVEICRTCSDCSPLLNSSALLKNRSCTPLPACIHGEFISARAFTLWKEIKKMQRPKRICANWKHRQPVASETTTAEKIQTPSTRNSSYTSSFFSLYIQLSF
jgi:hypothetical protein